MLFKSVAAAALLSSSFLASGVAAVYNAKWKNNTAVYWGQNAYGSSFEPGHQEDLFKTCNKTDIDIVIISFVTKFKGTAGYPIINLSDQCWQTFPLAENKKKTTDILNCPQIGTMITQCQALGKKILLSLGGATWQDPGFASLQAARDASNGIWAMFGPPGATPFKYRPFGNAVIDGFDLDFEHVINKPNVDYFANFTRSKFALDKKKKYWLTAAPQCFHPDATLDKALTTVFFDAIFIQFYNNVCQTSTWVKGKAQTSNNSFNLQMWQTWATTKSFNKGIKLFVGFLGGGLKGTTGYVSRPTAEAIAVDSQRFANFAGASFWDASVLTVNSPLLTGVKKQMTLNYIVKRDVVVEAREAEVVEEAVPEAINKFRRRHQHHHRL